MEALEKLCARQNQPWQAESLPIWWGLWRIKGRAAKRWVDDLVAAGSDQSAKAREAAKRRDAVSEAVMRSVRPRMARKAAARK
jgi:hypothetical protein